MLEVNSMNVRAWSRLGQRGTFFGLALPEIAKQHENIRLLTADLTVLSGLERFKNANPEKFLNVGIAEQNMIGIASGLAKEGNCVFTTTYATFISMRCFEQIRQNLAYSQFNVKLVGSSSGLVMGMSGNTHYAIEDIAILRAIPNMIILSPADSSEAMKMAYAAVENSKPMYIRLSGGLSCPIVYKEDYDFKIGKAVKLLQGKDVAIIATGTMVYESLQAAKLLQEHQINVTVVNMHTIKPLDTEILDELFMSNKLIVTAEEHSIIGGLGGAVAEYKATKANTPRQVTIGIPDAFGKAAEYGFLMNKYGLTAEGIANRIIAEIIDDQ